MVRPNLCYIFMNGNNPYAGPSNVTQAGHRSESDLPDLSPDQKRKLRRNVSKIAATTREYLPDEYIVDADVSHGAGGARATVAVQPPVGRPVSAGFTADFEANDESALVNEDDQTEVARGLAASAALQVKHAVSDNVSPTAR